MKTDVAKIISVDFSRSGASGLVVWETTKGKKQSRHGSLESPEMQSLFERAAREGVNMMNPSCGGCEGDLGPSSTYPWHYVHEDCRAIRTPVERAVTPIV